MKIVTWNCNGALRKKIDEISSLNADILVIQECEDPARSTDQYREWAGEYLWAGESKNKGVGIFPKHGNTVEVLNWIGEFKLNGLSSNNLSTTWNTSDLKLFLPFKINNDITALAVWTKENNSKSFSYIGQLWKYLQIHRDNLKGERTMILGDFNSNTRWDNPDRWWSHSDVVAELKEIGLLSLYHKQFNEAQGEENLPTFYLQRNPEKPYHIDYAFTSMDMINKSKLSIGYINDWIGVSDHMPITLYINS